MRMELSETIKEIEGLQQELKALLPIPREQQEKLDRKFRLEFNYNSNHIEGNTLTYGETELLLVFGETRGNHNIREYDEMKASDVALRMVEELATDKEHPLTEAFIKNLNKVLLVEPYWKEAITDDGQPTRRKIVVGDYKKFSNSVRLPNGEMFHYASPQETPILMTELIGWYKEELAKQEFHPVELAARLHYRFVRIHPFDDGNGRISRLLMNYVLLYHDYPPVVIKSADKANYLSALHDADTGNIESFVGYVAQQLIWSLELSLKAAKGESIEEDEDWKKKLSVLKKRVEDRDELQVTKSPEIIVEVLNSKILPFLNEVANQLGNVEELFLSKEVIYIDKTYVFLGHGYKFKIPEEFDLSIINVFQENALFQIIYFGFRKNGTKTFDVIVDFRFQFEKYKYNLVINDITTLSKLYHHDFSQIEIEKVANKFGRIVYAQIEEKLGISS